MANSSSETLGDFVRRIRTEKHLSLKDVSKQSTRLGKYIAASSINRIENERRRRPTSDSLTALAYGLGVPVEEILARAMGIVPSGNSSYELELITRFRELSPERQADVLKIVYMWYSEQTSQGTKF